MFRHVVCFRLKPEEKGRAAEAKQRIMGLAAIKEVKSIEVGLDNLKSPRSYDIILITDFDNIHDYKVYDAHELHQPVRQFMRSIVDSSVAVDFERD